MTDFTYDNEDYTAVRVATTDLINMESYASKALFVSSLVFIGYSYVTRKAPKSLWSYSPAGVIGGAFVGSSLMYLYAYCRYTALTWNSRSRLNAAAAHINSKYSSIIARTLNYEGIA